MCSSPRASALVLLMLMVSISRAVAEVVLSEKVMTLSKTAAELAAAVCKFRRRYSGVDSIHLVSWKHVGAMRARRSI